MLKMLRICDLAIVLLLLDSVATLAEARKLSATRSCTVPYSDDNDLDSLTLSNVTAPPDPRCLNERLLVNHSLNLVWTPSYLRSRDLPQPCNGVANAPDVQRKENPLNLATRSIYVSLDCNYTNITSNASSLVFYNLSASVDVFDRISTASWLLSVVLQSSNGTHDLVPWNASNYRTISSKTPAFTSYPNGIRVKTNTSFGNATLLITIAPKDPGRQTLPDHYAFNVSMAFQCETYCENALVVLGGDGGSAVLFAFLIPLVLIALVAIFAFVRYKFPSLFASDKKPNSGAGGGNRNNQQMHARAPAAQPLITEKAGMATWLDQAGDVVADLNKTQLYLAEAQPDKDPNANHELERLMAGPAGGAAGGGNPTLDAHTEGFVGGRRVFAAGGATVQQKEHKVTMAVKPAAPIDDDFL
jgi:hypothetical protein